MYQTGCTYGLIILVKENNDLGDECQKQQLG